jgi:hypothetical protein
MPERGRRMCLFKNHHMSILTSGIETSAWTMSDISRPTAAEMRFVSGRRKQKREQHKKRKYDEEFKDKNIRR